MSTTAVESGSHNNNTCNSNHRHLDSSKAMPRSCAVCQSVQNLKRCSRCKSIFYCCLNHQKIDWTQHRNVCSLTTRTTRKESNNYTDLDLTYSSPSCRSRAILSSGEPLLNSAHSHEALSQTEVDEDERSEIETILDFRSIKCESDNLHLDPEECTSKDIFLDLQNSTIDSYMGPSDGIFSSKISDNQAGLCLQATTVEESENDIFSEASCYLNPNEESSVDSQQLHDPECETDAALLDNHLYPPIVNKERNTDGKETDVCKSEADANGRSIPLDSRPMRKLKFPKPTSYEHKDLAEFIRLRLINLGYCILDEVFTDNHIDGLRAELLDLNAQQEVCDGQWNCPCGYKSSNDREAEKVACDHGDIKWIAGNEQGFKFTSKALCLMDSIMEAINPSLGSYGRIQGRTKAMISCDAGNGSFHRRRVDNLNKDGRRITCILYLNKAWDVQQDGGLLRLLPPHLDKPVDIPPRENRLVFFWSDKRNPYEVHPVYRQRISLTVWYFDSNEKEEAQLQELKHETDEISTRIAELEAKKRQLEEATRHQHIQNNAMEAVRSLSQEELEAVSFLVYNHPQPSQVMTVMGISPDIQDALILYLGNLEPAENSA